MKAKNLALRVLVAIFGIPLILSTIYIGKIPFLILVLVITTVSQYEMYKMTGLKGAAPMKAIGIIAGVLITLAFYFYGVESLWVVLIAALIISLLIELFRNEKNATLNVATTMWGILYPTTMFSFLILVRQLPLKYDLPYRSGGLWIIVLIITIWICDTAAYFIGSMMGRHKLFERVSPKKTLEGGVAGFVFSLITVYVFYRIYPDLFSLWTYMAIGVMVGIFSQIGDLVESIFKRDVEVKDSSAILPGHGGFMDRFDAPTFLAPMFYYFLVFLIL